MIEEAKEIRTKFDGLVRLTELPKVLFVFCARKHRTAILEAKKMKIPVVGVFGLDDNPNDAENFIPINDNSSPAVSMVLDGVREIYQQHKASKPAEKSEIQVPEVAAK